MSETPPDDAHPLPAAAPPETPPAIARLLRLVGGPRDGALLRHAIGTEWLKAGEPAKAAEAFQAAVDRDGNFSAGWKLLGRALQACARNDEARAAWQHGIAVANARGDLQAAREMTVFLRRIDRSKGV
jgi:predicted Zn-dependent protease